MHSPKDHAVFEFRLEKANKRVCVCVWETCFYLSSSSKILFPTSIFLFLLTFQNGDTDGKESACNAGDAGSIPRLGRCPGEGNGYPLQYSCLENPMDLVRYSL